MNLDTILVIVAGLVGFPAVISILIDILKWAGVVKDGQAGAWNAALNLIVLIAVASLVNFLPDFDIAGLDARLLEIGKFAGLILAYVVQIAEAKALHAKTLLYSYTVKNAVG